MPRSPNFAYQDPTGSIIQSLGRALFGDPAAHAAQAKVQSEAALREAQTGEAIAHGGLYGAQSADQTQRTGGALSMSQLIASMAPPQPAAPAPAQAAPSDTLAPLPEAPPPQAAPAFNPAEFQGRIAQVMAAMALAQGGKVDPGTVGSLSAMFGDDEYARRGMVAQGHTPGKEFAITPDRADVIRSDEAGNSLAQALGVAGVNHATDIPVANIRAGAARDVAVTNNRDDVPVARIAAQGKVDAAAGKPTTEKAPKAVGLAALNTLTREIDKGIAAKRLGVDPGAHQMIRERAVTEYQKSGNPVAAANIAIEWARQRNREGGTARLAASTPPAPGARKAADGKWYVQHGKNADGSPAYARVDITAAVVAERAEARAAIDAGAEPVAVAARFQQSTGQTF